MKNSKLKFRYRWTWNIRFHNQRFHISTPFFYFGIPTWKINWDYLLPDWVRYYQITKYEIEAQHHLDCICSDPMNGCPGDFAEDFHHKHRKIQCEIEGLSYSAWKPGKKLADYLLGRLYERLDNERQNLPWNQEPTWMNKEQY